MFWFSAIGVLVLDAFLACNAFIFQEVPQIFRYSAEQYFYLSMTGVFSALNLTCLTIAFQNDKSATVSLLAYIALVYAFLADIFIFKHDFVKLELAGAFVITFFNLFTIIYKMKIAPDEVDEY